MRVLFVLRHGHAERPSAGGERLLTAAGEADLARAAAGLGRAGLSLAAIAHSPLARARQTARAMAPLLAPGGMVQEADCLAPASDPVRAAAWLDAQPAAAGPTLVVGHMPEVAAWTALWAGAPEVARRGFAPGTMARLDVPGPLGPGGARLAWLLPVGGLAGSVDLTGLGGAL